MAAGTAVVTSDVYSIPEITGDAAVLQDPRDVDAHVASIEDLLANPKHRRRLAKRAKKRSKRFTWARSAERTLDVYRSVTGG
jgi:glycosyltransferase involved in cell wall biosynthesis